MKKFLISLAAAITTIAAFAKPQSSTPIDTVDVVCYDLVLNTNYIGLFGMTYIYANNADYKVTGAIVADSIPPGTYTDCLMDLKYLATGTIQAHHLHPQH